jgi:BirA family biotin operon repressor/biotin-[acetyl-CoA-carboxylase] ligase
MLHRGESVPFQRLEQVSGIEERTILSMLPVLEQEEYVLETESCRSVTLKHLPATQPVEMLRRALSDLTLGKPLLYFPAISSTNDVAKSAVSFGAPDGTIVVADTQRCGRGRFRRSWFSPHLSGLYFTLILHPECHPRLGSALNMAIAISTAKAIRHISDTPALVKWPNDIVIHGRKCGGILIESESDTTHFRYFLAGIGINLSISDEDFPGEIQDSATSIHGREGKDTSREKLLAEFLQRFSQYYPRVEKEDTAGIYRSYRSLSAVIGRRVRINLFDETLDARVLDIDGYGRIIAMTTSGKRRTISAGEILKIDPVDPSSDRQRSTG